MSFKVSKFLFLPIVSLRGVRKIMLANQENFDKKICKKIVTASRKK